MKDGDFQMRRQVSTVTALLCLSSCAPPGYHYEVGSFTPTPNNDGESSSDPLTWCRPAGFDQRVPMSVCQGATFSQQEAFLHQYGQGVQATKDADYCAQMVNAIGWGVSMEQSGRYSLESLHRYYPFENWPVSVQAYGLAQRGADFYQTFHMIVGNACPDVPLHAPGD
jgi:hypothetical protein